MISAIVEICVKTEDFKSTLTGVSTLFLVAQKGGVLRPGNILKRAALLCSTLEKYLV